MRQPFYLVIMIIAAGLACTGGTNSGHGEARTLTVFAAASLTEVFQEIAVLFEQRNPKLSVELNFAGSQRLRLQLEQGAEADVFASANDQQMEIARNSELIIGDPVAFASNKLALIVQRPNSGNIGSISDLANDGILLAFAHPVVPAGDYARQIIGKLAELPQFGADFERRVLDNLVTEESNVRSVLQKVMLGEVDAGIVYQSDARAVNAISVVPIPGEANITASYPVAVLKESPNINAAGQFVDFLISVEGQAILEHHGFGPPLAGASSSVENGRVENGQIERNPTSRPPK